MVHREAPHRAAVRILLRLDVAAWGVEGTRAVRRVGTAARLLQCSGRGPAHLGLRGQEVPLCDVGVESRREEPVAGPCQRLDRRLAAAGDALQQGPKELAARQGRGGVELAEEWRRVGVVVVCRSVPHRLEVEVCIDVPDFNVAVAAEGGSGWGEQGCINGECGRSSTVG